MMDAGEVHDAEEPSAFAKTCRPEIFHRKIAKRAAAGLSCEGNLFLPMSEPSEKTPSSAAELPSVEEFGQWLKADPANFDQYEGLIRQVVAGEFGELPPEMIEHGRKMLAEREMERALKHIQDKLREVQALMLQSLNHADLIARFAECNDRLDEISDLMLDLPDPKRTECMLQMHRIRELMRSYLTAPE
jgi:hypothetical protein